MSDTLDFRERFVDPEEGLRVALDSHQAKMWTALPGIVQSYDPARMIVSVQPAIQGTIATPDGKVQNSDLPVLTEVPVVYQRGGAVTLTFPIAAGDECLVVLSSRCIDAWWQLGGVQRPLEARFHDLSDGFAIVGPFSQKTKLANVSANTVQLRSADGATLFELDPAAQSFHFKGQLVTFDTPHIQLNGALSSTGDQVAGTVSLLDHVHPDPDTAPPHNTGPPVGGGAGGGGSPSGPLVTGALAPASVAMTQTSPPPVGAAVTPLATMLSMQRTTANLADDTPAVITTSIAGSGLAGGGSMSTFQVTMNLDNEYGSAGSVVVDGPGNNGYNVTITLNSKAVEWSGASTTPGAWSQHSAFSTSVVRTVPSGGLPPGMTMAQLWNVWLPFQDRTNLPSSRGGSVLGLEMDFAANDRDDAAPGKNRGSIGIYANPYTSLTNGGLPCEWGSAFNTAGHAAPSGQFDGFFRRIADLGGPYSVAVLDTRGAQAMDTTVDVALTSAGASLHVANVWGFTTGTGEAPYPISSTHPATVYVNGTPYTQVGWQSDGGGTTGGTLLFNTPVSVSDGAHGNAVLCAEHAIWLNTGQTIALSYDGSANIGCDTQGIVHIKLYNGLGMSLSPGMPALTYSRSQETVPVAQMRALLGSIFPGIDKTVA